MIPHWNISAVLPPVRPGAPGHSPDRSPYVASFSQIVERFATSAERIQILDGLLSYRAALEERGVTTGFQWLDGSFMEHKEALQAAAPNDVDVVTFFSLPPAMDEATFVGQNADLFNPALTKPKYRVDAYPYALAQEMGVDDIRQISYWYSMWSHRRDGVWKGFVQVSMSSAEDAMARALLTQIQLEAVAP